MKVEPAIAQTSSRLNRDIELSPAVKAQESAISSKTHIPHLNCHKFIST
ncbi:hypothetical protein [Nostoc commune]|nr:hypothetical protein [Nostoc commune]